MWLATGRDKSSGLLEEDRWPFILVDRLGAGEEVNEVAGGASGMGVDRICKIFTYLSF